MSKEHYLHLQHSETVVAQLAATLMSAFIQNQELNASNEDELVERALAIALKIANRADKLVKSDEEWLQNNTGSAYLGG